MEQINANNENQTVVTEDEVSSNKEFMHEHQLKWYIVQTYTGYENKVAADILATAKSRGLDDEIVATSVPLENEFGADSSSGKSSADGKGKKISKSKAAAKTVKKFPGYTMVKMCMAHDATWALVHNITGVMNFVGVGNTPVPLSDEEVDRMGINDPEVRSNIVIDFKPGDAVQVTNASFAGFKGKVLSVDFDKLEVTVEIDMFSRPAQLVVSYRDIVRI